MFFLSDSVFHGGGVFFTFLSRCNWCVALPTPYVSKVGDVEVFLKIHVVHRQSHLPYGLKGFEEARGMSLDRA